MEENNNLQTQTAILSLQKILTKISGSCVMHEEDDPEYFISMASIASNLAFSIQRLEKENNNEMFVLKEIFGSSVCDYNDTCVGDCDNCDDNEFF